MYCLYCWSCMPHVQAPGNELVWRQILWEHLGHRDPEASAHANAALTLDIQQEEARQRHAEAVSKGMLMQPA